MNTAEKIAEIERVLGLGESKSVVARINKKITELKKDFDNDISDNYYEIIDMANIEPEELSIDADPQRYELFESFKDCQYSIEYDEVESFISALDNYFNDRYYVVRQIRDLKDLLE